MRKLNDLLIATVAGLCALVSVGILAGLVLVVAQRGVPALSWSFFTEQIRLVGAAGGIFWNLIGTMILLGAAFLICAPMAVGLALVERVWLRGGAARRALRTVLYTLNGLPSILFGLFGFIVFVQWCGWGKSWLVGGIVLALSMLPTVTVSLIERLKAIPSTYLEAAAALGLNRAQIVWAVLLPQAWGGLITGSLLGLARAAGETAPIMFTCTIFAGATWPHGIKESPVLTLPYHIFILAQDSFDPAVGAKLWGAALVLLGLVFLLSLIALPSRLKIHEEADV
ncbi:MAG: phosphate transport system permease protein [Chthoniobacter sp.]|jgi:phosphate transport system permease protein|nr:phosphate transport system permease protein [Chthoniobacter sp.]